MMGALKTSRDGGFLQISDGTCGARVNSVALGSGVEASLGRLKVWKRMCEAIFLFSLFFMIFFSIPGILVYFLLCLL